MTRSFFALVFFRVVFFRVVFVRVVIGPPAGESIQSVTQWTPLIRPAGLPVQTSQSVT